MTEKWRRASADFASRKLGRVEEVVGTLKPARRKKIRSYFYRKAIDWKTMREAEYKTKYSDPSRIPEEIRKNPELW